MTKQYSRLYLQGMHPLKNKRGEGGREGGEKLIYLLNFISQR